MLRTGLRIVKVEGNLVTLNDGTTINQEAFGLADWLADFARMEFLEEQCCKVRPPETFSGIDLLGVPTMRQAIDRARGK